MTINANETSYATEDPMTKTLIRPIVALAMTISLCFGAVAMVGCASSSSASGSTAAASTAAASASESSESGSAANGSDSAGSGASDEQDDCYGDDLPATKSDK